MTFSPEVVRADPSRNADWARQVFDFVTQGATEGLTIQVTAVTGPAYSPAEVADLVGVSRATVQRRIDDKTIKAVKRGSRWRVPEAEVDRYRSYLVDQMAELVNDDLD